MEKYPPLVNQRLFRLFADVATRTGYEAIVAVYAKSLAGYFENIAIYPKRDRRSAVAFPAGTLEIPRPVALAMTR
jgi:hypothetical protein